MPCLQVWISYAEFEATPLPVPEQEEDGAAADGLSSENRLELEARARRCARGVPVSTLEASSLMLALPCLDWMPCSAEASEQME